MVELASAPWSAEPSSSWSEQAATCNARKLIFDQCGNNKTAQQRNSPRSSTHADAYRGRWRRANGRRTRHATRDTPTVGRDAGRLRALAVERAALTPLGRAFDAKAARGRRAVVARELRRRVADQQREHDEQCRNEVYARNHDSCRAPHTREKKTVRRTHARIHQTHTRTYAHW